MKNIVIFASGSGTNAQAILDYFKDSENTCVSLILSNKKKAPVLDRAQKAGIPAMSFNRHAFAKAGPVHSLLKSIQPDLIVLAGFLWKIPEFLITDFPNQIINLHPSLLPKYGGKGMYGIAVHEAVLANKESKSGITIHFVNEEYDKGAYIAQFECDVMEGDTPSTLAGRIHQLEHQHLPATIEKLLHG
ncbi:phosphoribosylglycinamide formyltransferase [Nonlabens spongiae]|uniref:Phosphoribosylglycinamide formyltransferase n=1 Tax=Nonlabens spongiae TaxID=331648 RepID=A0A1W6MPD4_9FLAO|nr:phosphoribosylglycinamide formyltransferase [Nonlabens spongiae]ARN79483.1 phosphoribosylglycinamide formyltransferase [Nonlabens spongiae]